jgi:hypothetical protein
VTARSDAGRRAEVALGLLSLASFAVHAWHFVVRRQEANLLWFCHLAALAVGVALLARAPTWNAIGLLWLCVGIPCWLLYLASGGELMAGSVLTHGVGFGAGLFGVRRLGLPAGAWWKAVLALALVFALTRAVTPPAANVNLAFAIWPGWETWFPSHVAYIAVLTVASIAVFVAVTWTLRRSGFAAPTGER